MRASSFDAIVNKNLEEAVSIEGIAEEHSSFTDGSTCSGVVLIATNVF